MITCWLNESLQVQNCLYEVHWKQKGAGPVSRICWDLNPCTRSSQTSQAPYVPYARQGWSCQQGMLPWHHTSEDRSWLELLSQICSEGYSDEYAFPLSCMTYVPCILDSLAMIALNVSVHISYSFVTQTTLYTFFSLSKSTLHVQVTSLLASASGYALRMETSESTNRHTPPWKLRLMYSFVVNFGLPSPSIPDWITDHADWEGNVKERRVCSRCQARLNPTSWPICRRLKGMSSTQLLSRLPPLLARNHLQNLPALA